MRREHIDGALKKIIPQSFRHRILALSHQPPLFGHLEHRHMYETVHRDFFWPSNAVEAYDTTSTCESCAMNSCNVEQRRLLHLFATIDPFELVAVDIIGPLPRKTTKVNQHAVIINDRYSKLTRGVLSAQITTTIVAKIFFNACVIPYGIPAHLLADNSSRFVSKLFKTLCNYVDKKHSTATAYHPRTSGPME